MIIAMSLIAVLLIFLGWGVHKKKWYFLISGYNTMSAEEQAKVDVEQLAKWTARICYSVAVLLVLISVFAHFELWALLTITTVLIVVVPFIMAFRSYKYQKAGQSKKSKMISLVVTIVSLIVVGVIIFSSTRPTTYIVDEQTLTIEGSYGETIVFDDTTSVELVNDLPDIKARTNGSSIGSKHRGNFKLKNDEKVKLFVDEAVPPFIKLQTNEQTYYFNETDAQKTQELYEKLSQN